MFGRINAPLVERAPEGNKVSRQKNQSQHWRMQVLIFDGEQGLKDGEARVYIEIRGIAKREAAVGQRTRIVDRRAHKFSETH